MQTLPERPDIAPAPAPKKKGWWSWKTAGLILLGLMVLGTIANLAESEPKATTPSTPAVAPVESDVDVNLEAARIAWDEIPASEQDDLCEYYLTPPKGLTPDLIQAFADGSGYSYTESERVLVVLLDEEC